VDSVVLLHLLRRAGYDRLVVCHLHHGLRGVEADADAAFVRELAAEHRCGFELRSVDVAALAAETGLSIETAGRVARREFFGDLAAARHIARVFLAHQAEDQAETVLMNLLRGAGLNGLAGMREATPGGPHWQILRPLLAVRRSQIVDYAHARHLRWREDASNQARSHLRNRLRLDVLPALIAAMGHDVHDALIRSARLASEDDAWIEGQAEKARIAIERPDRTLEVAAMRQLPVPLARRVLRGWIRNQGVPDLGGEIVDAALAVLHATARPASLNLPGGYRLRRRAGILFLDHQNQPAQAKPRAATARPNRPPSADS
jgi:tRNA(Ile)-lysidine synthase